MVVNIVYRRRLMKEEAVWSNQIMEISSDAPLPPIALLEYQDQLPLTLDFHWSLSAELKPER